MALLTKLQRQRKKALKILLAKADKDVPMLIDYHLDEFLRKLLNLPKRPENRLPYDGWMIDEPQRKRHTNNISQAGVDLIKKWEGYRRDAYLCPAKVWTIGYGHTKGVLPSHTVTLEQAEALLKKDLIQFESAVRSIVKVPLNQNQFDALVSFCFNIGTGAFSRSTLVKFLNQKRYSEAANEFLRWNKAGGRVIQGLSNRRQEEKHLFLS